VLPQRGQRGEDEGAWWEPRAARGGGRRWLAMVSGGRVEGWEEAPGSRTRGPAEAGWERPHGGAVAHGGPLCWRGSWRMTTNRPWRHCGQGGPARRGRAQVSSGRVAGAGETGGGAGACRASQSWRWGRRARWTGLHSP
jgi:hypothetical protein